MPKPAVLALEDGSCFVGEAIGAVDSKNPFTVGEVVFNTSMTGYQEILTDPSYADQLITFTSPHIGNVGTNPQDMESRGVFAKGIIIRELSPVASSWRCTQNLNDFLKAQGVLGIAQIDTRHLTSILRAKGALKGCIQAADSVTEHVKQEALEKARSFSGLQGSDLAKEVTTSSPYIWQRETIGLDDARSFSHPPFFPIKIFAYDFGIKYSILRNLSAKGCQVHVVPAKTPIEAVLEHTPDGVFFSNGPGDPLPCTYAVEAIQTCIEKSIPVFGICLGYQLLALACGAKTFKMKFGHHGGNHPVQDLATKRVMITSQNHGFAVNEETLPDTLQVTHRSLFDNTLQGLAHKTKPAFGFQGHPEAGPGPNDMRSLFDQFLILIQKTKRFELQKSPIIGTVYP